MMVTVGIHYPPLSYSVRQAWKTAGLTRLYRYTNNLDIGQVDHLICLGASASHVQGASVWNPKAIRHFMFNPQKFNTIFEAEMPNFDEEGDEGFVWIKSKGYKGRGKWMLNTESTSMDDIRRFAEERKAVVQAHVQGTEYRVITVGNKVIQGFKKTPILAEDTNIANTMVIDSHLYEWVGLQGMREESGFIPFVKNIVEKLHEETETEKTVIGWDIIHRGKNDFKLIEGNTCPGVNVYTARRILAIVHGVSTDTSLEEMEKL